MAFRPKPDHVHYEATADIVGFRKRIKCPLIVQLAGALWIVYSGILVIDGLIAIVAVGNMFVPLIRFFMAMAFIGIAWSALSGGAKAIWGYAWLSILLGWVQVLFLLIYLGQAETERPPLINYTPIVIPLTLVVAGVLALAGNTRYLNWRKKRGSTKA